MAPLVRHLLRGLAVIVTCGPLSACVVAPVQPYGGGYFGPGSGTGYGRYYGPGGGYFGPGSGTGYGRYYGSRGWR